MASHRSKNSCLLYKYIDGDWDNWYIELYEYYPCNNKPELDKREGQVTREIGNINKNIAGRTPKEYRQENIEKCLENSRQYRQNNKDKIKEYFKNHWIENRDSIKEKRNQKADEIIQYARQYREDNRDKISEQRKQKTICEHCGSIVRKGHIARHQRSQKCINFKPS